MNEAGSPALAIAHLPTPGALLLSWLLQRLLGLPASVTPQIENARLVMGNGWSPYLALALWLIGVLWFGALYLKDGRTPSLWVKAPLLLLRLLALAALLCMLLQPAFQVRRVERLRPHVALLVDESLSMAQRDTRLPAPRAAKETRAAGEDATRLTRAQIAERLINSNRGHLLAELMRRFEVHAYTFAAEAAPAALPSGDAARRGALMSVRPNPARGDSTQIGTALRRAANDLAGQPGAGILVVSDGGSNLGEDPVAAAQRAREQGLPVSALGIGDPTPTRDLAITEALADQVVRKDNVTRVYVGLAHRGYAGRDATVTLRRGNETVAARTVRLGPEAHKQTVTFSFTPRQTGLFPYTITATPLPGEITAANNRRSFLQRVVSRRLRILYVEGEPRWEYRYLRNAILRDTQIAFSCFLTASGTRLGGEGNVPVRAFPSDEKSLFEYDILILGDVPRRFFTDNQIGLIRRFVENRGASLILICGERHLPEEYRNSALETLFPVALPPSPEQVRTVEPFPWQITAEGRRDPLLRLSDDPAENERLWRSLPGMLWHVGALRARPGATVLAVNPVRQNAYGSRILLAVEPFGAGRCLMALTDSTWRWRYRVGDRYFYRYWGQVVRAMTPQETPGGNRFAQVSADRAEYRLGERVSLHARLLDSFYRPIGAQRVIGALKSEAGDSVPVEFAAVPGSPGLYTADLLADRTGRFQVSIASPAAPQARATTSYLVQSPALEQQRPELDEALLKRIATAGGGRYYAPDELRRWIDSLNARSPEVRSETAVEIWDTPLLLVSFILPLALEWLIRKRTGMM